VAEIGGQGTWQVAVLGIVMTGSDRQQVRSQLQRALVFLEELHLAEVTGSDFELLEMCYEGAQRDEDEALTAADFGAHHDREDEE
jgi:hypothetical protein